MSANEAAVAANLFDTGVQTEADAAAAASKASGGDETAQAAAAQAVKDKTAWSMADGLPGSGQAPTWFDSKKYKTVSDQAAAVPELVTKLGSANTGAPEKYNLALAEGEFSEPDHPLLLKVQEIAKGAGISQGFFTELLEAYAANEAAETTAQDAATAAAYKDLGADAKERLDDIDAWLKATFPDANDEKLRDTVKAWCVSGDDVSVVERLMKTGAGGKVPRGPGNASGHTPESVKALKFAVLEEGPHKGELRTNHDPEYRKEVQQAYKDLYGDAPQHELVG